MFDEASTQSSRPKNLILPFGLPPVSLNANRTANSFKTIERERIRFFWKEEREAIKCLILHERNKTSRTVKSTGTLLKNLYYVGDSYIINSFYPNDDNLTITEDRLHRKEGIIGNIILLENLTHQTENILKTGKKSIKHFIASISHLEAERILAISKIRKDVLVNYLTQASANHVNNVSRRNRDFTIKTINCQVSSTNKSVPIWKYYFCILTQQTTVYGSIFVPANPEGDLVLEGPFIFENISCDSNISLKFYTLELEYDFYKKEVDSFVLPLMKLSAEFTIDPSSVRLKQCCIKPVYKGISHNSIENLSVTIVQSNKTIERSLA